MTKSPRLRRNSAQMYAIVASYEQSGLSQSAFCTAHSLSLHVFRYWLSRYRSANRNESVLKSMGFKEILSESPDVGAPLGFVRIRDSRGMELEFECGVSASFLRSLLSW